MKPDREPNELNFVLPDETIYQIRSFAIPEEFERIQIRGKDYRIVAREWTVDYADSPTNRAVRVCFELEEWGT